MYFQGIHKVLLWDMTEKKLTTDAFYVSKSVDTEKEISLSTMVTFGWRNCFIISTIIGSKNMLKSIWSCYMSRIATVGETIWQWTQVSTLWKKRLGLYNFFLTFLQVDPIWCSFKNGRSWFSVKCYHNMHTHKHIELWSFLLSR